MSTLNEVVNLPNFNVNNGILNRTSWQDNLRPPLGVPVGSIIMYAGYTGPCINNFYEVWKRVV